MAEHPIKGLMETAMGSIKNMIDVNTIVGQPVSTPDGTVIIPISKVSFGFGAGGSEFGERTTTKNDELSANFGGGTGGGAVIEPVAFMVVGNGQIRLMPIDKNPSPVEEIMSAVPGLLDKTLAFFKGHESKNAEDVFAGETIDAE